VMGLRGGEIGAIYPALAIVKALFYPLAGRFVDRYGEKLGYIVYFIASAAGTGAFLTLSRTHPWLAVFSLIPAAVLGTVSSTSFTTYVAKMAPAEVRGTVYSAYSVITVPFLAVAPTVGAVLWSISPSGPFVLSIALTLLSIALVLKM